jgi:hypothetical protein
MPVQPDPPTGLRRIAALLSLIGVGLVILPAFIFLGQTFFQAHSILTSLNSGSGAAFSASSISSPLRSLLAAYPFIGIGLLLICVSTVLRISASPKNSMRAMQIVIVVVAFTVTIGIFIGLWLFLLHISGTEQALKL